MNILWITAIYPSANSPAEGVFHRTQAEALAALGVTIRVIAPVPWIPACLGRMSRRWSGYSDYPLSYEENGVEVYRPKFFAHPRHFFYGFPHRFMAMAVNRIKIPPPDLIHAHLAFPCGLAARQVARRHRVPYLLTLHGGDVHSYPQVNSQCHHRFLRAVQGARSVIAVGDALARTAERLSGVCPRVQPIGINLTAFANRPGRAEARRILQLPEDKYVVLYVGRLVQAKGIGELLEALRHNYQRPILGVLLGDGPLYEKAAADPCIRAEGPVHNNRLPLYLAAADSLILPSYKEGLPTVLVEAGACALPVIATRIDGVTDLLRSNRGHLIEPKSAQAIVKGIRHIMANRPYAERIALELQKHVLENYDVAKNARSLLQLYKEALPRPYPELQPLEACA